MMNNYLIAGIKLRFSYKYDTYFKNNIEAYLYHGEDVDHTIEVKYAPQLILPKDKLTRVFSKSVNEIKSFMAYDEAYKHVEIWIDSDTFGDPATAEYIYTGMIFLEIAQQHGLLPMHASAILYKNEVLLFSAPSGTGKSTHAKLWKSYLKDQVTWVNDDKPLLEIKTDKVFVYGSPFSGAHHQNTNVSYPLKSIVFLQQGITDEVTKLDAKQALLKLIQNTLRPSDERIWDQALHQFEFIISNYPMYLLDASMSVKAVQSIKKTIYGADDEN